MIKYDFEDLKNSGQGKIAFVCGLGPSLAESINFIKDNRENIILISCNDVDINTDLVPDYWVFANSVETVTSMIGRFRKNPSPVIVHADSVDPTPREWIEKNMSDLNYIGYDQRHFNNATCNECSNFCGNFVDGRLTLQEELQKFTNYKSRYSTGDTVALHMLALAVLLGCEKIYVTGVDLDYTKGYYGTNFVNSDTFNPYLKYLLDDFKLIDESAKNIGIEIINLSKSSHLMDVLKTESL